LDHNDNARENSHGLGRLHPATLWGGLLLIASQPFRLWLSGAAAWLSVASRLI